MRGRKTLCHPTRAQLLTPWRFENIWSRLAPEPYFMNNSPPTPTQPAATLLVYSVPIFVFCKKIRSLKETSEPQLAKG
ncbi:hypothetical protein N657DRAFT_644489 [Parathielavia appendiculata]|uniref:Uncharacterized protein n=1 Tax=Parathielavia appendiculata TaxID=2587402 RepID=A0AAN6U318_9PEZI|nr:hypothetical protein N657DRAFT_644489 [Parathielavia appendiculata]